MKRFKIVGIILMSLFLLISCISCTKKEELSPKKKTIIKWTLWGGKNELKIMNKMAKLFEKSHPQIELKLIHISGDYMGKLITMIAGGTPPDLMYMHTADFPAFVKKGIVLNLQPYIDKDKEFNLNDFYPMLIDLFRYKGDVYGLPKDFSPLVLGYNKKMFDEAGVPYPDGNWTWETFLNACKKLTHDKNGDGRIDQFGFVCEGRDWFWMPFIWQNGGKFLNKDKSECLLNSPESIEAIQFFGDLINKFHVAPTFSQRMDIGGGRNIFRMGKAAMFFDIRAGLPDIRKIKDFEWDVAPIPHQKERATPFITCAFLISKQSKHPQETWEVLKFLKSPEVEGEITKLGSGIPTRKKVSYSKVFFDSLPPNNDQVYIDEIKNMRSFPYTLNWREIMDVTYRELELVWLGKRSAKEACEILKPEIDNLLKKL